MTGQDTSMEEIESTMNEEETKDLSRVLATSRHNSSMVSNGADATMNNKNEMLQEMLERSYNEHQMLRKMQSYRQ